MAEFRDQSAKGVTPEQVAGWIELLLSVADKIVRLFGRRRSDRPARQEPDVTPPRESPGRRAE
jgi:hypothetical protein